MIKRDRELLARLSRLGQALGGVHAGLTGMVLRLVEGIDTDRDSAPNPVDLREIGGGLVAVASEMAAVGRDMSQRAAELDHAIGPPPAERSGESCGC